MFPPLQRQLREANNSEEIEVVGTVNQVLLPHIRQHCTIEPYCRLNRADGTTLKKAARQELEGVQSLTFLRARCGSIQVPKMAKSLFRYWQRVQSGVLDKIAKKAQR
jgi:hypothetical protein